MRIGIDFDNTIVDYDALFHRVASEWKVISPETPRSKQAVRDHLRLRGNETQWTEMQGYVYGARMSEARPYPGALEFLQWARDGGHIVSIISHKTRQPFLGPPYDLHTAAREWIAARLVSDGIRLVPEDRVFFEITKEEKLARIAALQCDAFIDDLPEIFLSEQFPSSVTLRLLFDPERRFAIPPGNGLKLLHGWSNAAMHCSAGVATA